MAGMVFHAMSRLDELKDLADYAVDYVSKLGATYAEARAQIDSVSSFVLKNGNVEAGYIGRFRGLGLRLIFDGALGFTSINEARKELVKRGARDALSMARASSGISQKVRLSEERVAKEEWGVREKVPFEDVAIKEKIDFLLSVDKGTTSVKGVKVPARLIDLTEMRTEKYLVTSDGCEVSSYVPRISVDVLITAVKGNDSEQGMFQRGRIGGWEAVEGWNVVEECGKRARALGDILMKAKKAPTGKIDLLVGSEVVGLAVHESTGHPYEADRILGRETAQAGESFVRVDMLGTRIGSEVVSVLDDPTLENGYGSYRYDDEGVAARPRYLIKDGVINEFLQNRETAEELSVKSNAAARASDFAKEPIIRMANTYMAPGDHDFEELLEGVKFGVFIKSYEEWNIDDIRYNMRFVGSEAHLIEKGELQGLVRRPVIELTTPKFYSSIDALTKHVDQYPGQCGKGDPMQGIPVWFGGPTIRLRGVQLGVIR